MDAHALLSISRVPTIFFLSWLLREFFRCTTFRDERRLAAHGRVHVAAVVSQLVPAALSVHLCSVPLRRTLTFEKSSGVRPYSEPAGME